VSWSVIWRRRASDILDELTRRDPVRARRIVQRITAYAATGQGDVRKLAGMDGRWRLRVGDWRVIFIFDPPGSITVLTLSDRRDAYR
jgi:mRNA-degrading endonuclease RelE of RelBE toxin-antitoxin system